ncbi:MAB_1171c family putative transporter [Streptomyces sp. ISL-86]|uniref:MAB_1171c family putative transporter n=1 Tax=Streptomyces sp. ISL-86 TaxID=2819187 RepID=UPI001BE64573|nr:MAB_1171c family putative transporter [Streptomyces sp. ISL-86]MBT2454174.1 hypothetical protein [Streptomyces sp. ISL-86]
MAATTVTVLFLVLLAAAVTWKFFQLTKDPRNPPLRAVTLCLVCAATSYPLAMPGGATGLDAVAGHGAAKLMQNILLLMTCHFLMCFYLYSAADARAGRRRARSERLVLLLVIVAITVTALTAPHTVLSGSFASADMTIPQVAVFYLVAGLYLMYAITAAFWWTRRYARISQRPLSTGLWLTAVGLGGMAAACGIRAVFVVIRSQGNAVPAALTAVTSMVLVLSVPLFVIGVTYPGARNRLTAIGVWHQHRTQHRQLHPLWLLLSEAFPHTVLYTAGSGSRRSRWRSGGVHRRYHRRVIECRDGLVLIGPYLTALRAGATTADDAALKRVAERLDEAERSCPHAGTGPERAMALAIPQHRDRDADVRQLLQLSDALRAAN